jgi:uncharacterized protein (DUF1499 family)
MATTPPSPSWQRRLLWRLVHAATVVMVLFTVLSMSSTPPTTLGLHSGRLAPCPATPNCVSSLADQADQKVAPFGLDRPVAEAKSVVKAALAALPRTRLVREDDNYLHFEFRSLIFRFVDDVEFHFDQAGRAIHIRSASRVGHSDFGVNRRRVETIRALLPAALQNRPD